MRVAPTLSVLLAAACLAAAPAAAQRFVSAGQSVTGTLDASDATLDDGSFYEVWNYRGRAGERITIRLHSDAFDAYLAFGRLSGGECSAECKTDDDGGGGTDARIRVEIPETGVYQIRVNALNEGQTGAFTLAVTSGTPVPETVASEVRMGQTVSSTLEDADAEADDGSFQELWTYRGPEGQRIVITMRSDDFDTLLGWGRRVGGEWQELETNDDGLPDGTDSCLDVTLGDDGAYTIRAGALSPGETGSYTLTVAASGECTEGGLDDEEEWEEEEAEEGPADLSRAVAVRAGGPHQGRLDDDDPLLGEAHYDLYTYMGRAGERLTILMASSDFDSFVAIGRVEQGMFAELASNDDGEEGLDSVLEFTLPASGTYVIRARSLSGGETGAYTLEVRSAR
ncbi:MAG TPA: hypothetical protein VEW03_13450 [Longimicrobiaceae bacterium]|nr:hypothetical protein [Longimicrobiaceae bacterium]